MRCRCGWEVERLFFKAGVWVVDMGGKIGLMVRGVGMRFLLWLLSWGDCLLQRRGGGKQQGWVYATWLIAA